MSGPDVQVVRTVRDLPAAGHRDPARLFWRFFAWLIAISLIVAILFTWMVVRRERTSDLDDIRRDLRRTARLTADLVAPALVSGDPAGIARVVDVARSQGIRITVIGADGRVLADTSREPAAMDNHLNRPEIAGALRSGEGAGERVRAGTGVHALYYAVAIVRDGALRGFVRTAATDSDVALRRATMLRTLVLGTSALMAAGLLGAVFFLSRFTGQFRGETELLLERDSLYDRIRQNEAALIAEQRQLRQRTEELHRVNTELARLAVIVEASDDAILSKDRNGIILTWNDAAERMFGYAADDIVGLPVDRLVPADLLDQEHELRGRVFSTGIAERRQTRRVRKDGSMFDAALTMSPIAKEGGSIQAVAVLMRDVSVEAATRDLLIERERQLTQAQQIGRLGSWSWDTRTNEVSWSDEQFRMLGLPPRSCSPTLETFLAFVHPDDVGFVTETIATSVRAVHGFDFHHRVVLHDGRIRTFHGRGEPVTDAAGAVIKMVGISQDVTEQVEAIAALKRSEERFKLATRATSEGIWEWDVEKNVTWWNDAFYALLGYQRAQLQPCYEVWREHVHPEDRQAIEKIFDEFLASDRDALSREYRFKRADGAYITLLDRTFALRDKGKVVRITGSVQDITQRRQAERMKSDFVSFTSHQLRTPLSGMCWMLELAAGLPGLPAEARSYIDEAQESAQRLVALVNDLLDVSGLESGKIAVRSEAVDLCLVTRALLAETRSLTERKGHHLVVELKAGPARTDAQLIRQAIGNLLSNAIKYTPPGGTITVSSFQTKGTVRWQVSDNGIGIQPAAQARLFEKFYRADNAVAMVPEGTGLGLHIVRLIVEQFGGHAWCHSEAGRGATFGFTLPAVETS